MQYGYFPSPARSEPAFAARSSGHNADVLEYVRTALRARPTRSVPPSFPLNRTSPEDGRRRAVLGLGLGLPSTFLSLLDTSQERPILRPQADYRLGTPFTSVPVRSIRRRVAAAHPPAPITRARSTDYLIRPALRLDVDHLRISEQHDAIGSAIALTLEDAFESEGEDDSFGSSEAEVTVPRYNFLPPGLSSPVPWPSSPVSPASTNVPSPRPMTFRRLAGPGMRAPGDVTPTGAPLSPSISHVGTHRHFPGLDHRAGGDADEYGMPVPMAMQTRTVRPPRTPRLPSIEYFVYDPLYQ
ncbi:hypothetical protein BN946_scf184798.g7 [Trametes cinnabarina]|uniref:Uncharacterized protein n=1 Tax=Pycnoporus cinnabarinus TaxID=5643 RepID=A0A060S884_PYCCI|nr:hypothetical protein BN946_scf184798.g7 [Trametes cinnabarina]